MGGESKENDCKLKFDHSSERAKVELVRHIVAISNAGGGSIIFGHDEAKPTGIDQSQLKALDSSRVSKWVNSFIKPATIDLAHVPKEISDGRFLLTLVIPAAKYPLAMAKAGFWKGADTSTDHPVFNKCDVLTRHSTNSEKANYEDYRRWIENARHDEREMILDRLSTYVYLPEGKSLEVVDESGADINSPLSLIRSVKRRRQRDPDHLISGSDLLWVFLYRHNTLFSESDLAVLIAGALRRGPTLYYWLLLAEDYLGTILDEVEKALIASDRDKSDAARNLVEVTAIYLDDDDIDKVIQALGKSRYTHFREEARAWVDRDTLLRKISQRITASQYEEGRMIDASIDSLEEYATDLTTMLMREKSISSSRRLADCTRSIWARKSKHADFIGT